MAITLFLLSILLFGLILLAIGIILLLKVKNKLAGMFFVAFGLVCTLVASAIFLSLIITTRTMGWWSNMPNWCWELNKPSWSVNGRTLLLSKYELRFSPLGDKPFSASHDGNETPIWRVEEGTLLYIRKADYPEDPLIPDYRITNCWLIGMLKRWLRNMLRLLRN